MSWSSIKIGQILQIIKGGIQNYRIGEINNLVSFGEKLVKSVRNEIQKQL